MPVFSVSKNTYIHLGPLKLAHIRKQKLQHGLDRTILCDYCTVHSKNIYKPHKAAILRGQKHCSLHVSS
uniref:Uncharacterized protein n=1 Tax=Anguilla anguilla TaxID=7936 RepID=A0A0E9XH71_ANGAN